MAPCSSERVSCCLGSLINTGKNGQASQLLPLVSSWSCPGRSQEALHHRGMFFVSTSFYKYSLVVGTVGMWEGPVLWLLPSVGGKGGTVLPFHAFHGRSISTIHFVAGTIITPGGSPKILLCLHPFRCQPRSRPDPLSLTTANFVWAMLSANFDPGAGVSSNPSANMRASRRSWS